PDHFYDTGDEGLRKARTSFHPFRGKGAIGIITFSQRVPNYREYVTVKLNEPLQVGKTYLFSFHASSGYLTAFGNVATNGLGVYFSTVPFVQNSYEPVLVKPQFFLEEVFFTYGWKEFSFQFTPTLPYEYLTLGNFFADHQLKIQYFFFEVDPQAYIFLDEINLEQLPTKEDSLKKEIVSSASQEKALPLSLKGRNINEQHRFKVYETKIQLWIWDDEKIDGDVVSLYLGEECVLPEQKITARKKKISIELGAEKEQFLVLYAHNLGKIPPNTAKLLLKIGRKKYEIDLSSTLKESGAVRLVRE
ncbi:MAG: hypothetical protein RMJ89_04820, partial [Flammeovirgaceae bacterium]|nr:hypothetical protein [Flammeovirgaceae bacterium]